MAFVWFGGAIYLTRTGILMMFNDKYRNETTRTWFRIENEAHEKRQRRFVRFVEGPLYVLTGLGMLVLGWWMLSL
jgi:hypothetical protein